MSIFWGALFGLLAWATIWLFVAIVQTRLGRVEAAPSKVLGAAMVVSLVAFPVWGVCVAVGGA